MILMGSARCGQGPRELAPHELVININSAKLARWPAELQRELQREVHILRTTLLLPNSQMTACLQLKKMSLLLKSSGAMTLLIEMIPLLPKRRRKMSVLLLKLCPTMTSRLKSPRRLQLETAIRPPCSTPLIKFNQGLRLPRKAGVVESMVKKLFCLMHAPS